MLTFCTCHINCLLNLSESLRCCKRKYAKNLYRNRFPLSSRFQECNLTLLVYQDRHLIGAQLRFIAEHAAHPNFNLYFQRLWRNWNTIFQLFFLCIFFSVGVCLLYCLCIWFVFTKHVGELQENILFITLILTLKPGHCKIDVVHKSAFLFSITYTYVRMFWILNFLYSP